MESLAEDFIKSSGFIKNKTYFKEIYSLEVEKLFNLDLTPLSNISAKRWDFVIKTEKIAYLTETNFYSSSGFKLNEIAKSYIGIAKRAGGIKGIEFMRITDGWGWRKAKKNLQEAYIEIPYLFGTADMEEGLFKTLGPLMFLLWQKIVRRGIKKPPPHAKEQRRVKRRRISREQGGRMSAGLQY